MLQSRWAPKSDGAAQSQKPAASPSPSPPSPSPPAEKAATTAESQPAPEAQMHASATSYEPAYDDPSIDPFAQTASTDDLFFDDDMTPIPEPVAEPPVAQFVPDEEPPQEAAQLQPAPHTPREPRGPERGSRARGRPRGRGRGRGGHAPDARENTDKKAQPEPQNVAANEIEPTPAPAPAPAPAPVAANTASTASTEPTDALATPSAPTEPKDKPTHSVRGDRTLTGGTARTRLTEEQLNAKLANMRSKNEALQTAHARAEADLAKFEAREAVLKKQDVQRKKILAEKQKVERQNRAQMMGERERNRQRKLNAQGGREWDFEKEEGFSGTGEERNRGPMRGAHGGVASSRPADIPPPTDQPGDLNPSQSYRGRGRGRGGRGNRGGRGDHAASSRTEYKKHDEQQPPSAADFPELPSSTTSGAPKDTPAPKNLEFPAKSKAIETKNTETELERPGIKKQESFGLPLPMEKGRSWADEVS